MNPALADLLARLEGALAEAPPEEIPAISGELRRLEVLFLGRYVNAHVAAAVAAASPAQEPTYLSIQELAKKIPYREGTIRNLMSQGKLQQGIHYMKKNNGRIVFFWPAVRQWVEEAERGS